MKLQRWELDVGEIVLYYQLTNSEIRKGCINLTKLEYKAFKLLSDMKLHPKEDIVEAIYNHREITMKDAFNMKEVIHRLNKKIKPIGQINNEYSWGYKFIGK